MDRQHDDVCVLESSVRSLPLQLALLTFCRRPFAPPADEGYVEQMCTKTSGVGPIQSVGECARAQELLPRCLKMFQAECVDRSVLACTRGSLLWQPLIRRGLLSRQL